MTLRSRLMLGFVPLVHRSTEVLVSLEQVTDALSVPEDGADDFDLQGAAGTGLGMSISCEIIQRHGGRI